MCSSEYRSVVEIHTHTQRVWNLLLKSLTAFAIPLSLIFFTANSHKFNVNRCLHLDVCNPALEMGISSFNL